MPGACGFTLIELCMALCVLAIIAMIALPSYATATRKARRSEGKIFLQTVLAAEERYYLTFNRYTNVAGAGGLGLSSDSQPGGYYALAKLDVASDRQTVVATVDPQKGQEGDSCGSLTLDSSGHRGASDGTAADCW